ncbi:MAG: response regulator transcription factor [Planctomycetota bacterium]
MAEPATVFLVDDDPGALRSLKWLIEQADLPVRAFASAEEFLAAYIPSQPGCLVLDVCMPKLDGIELQKTLRLRGIRIPIIFVTGHGDVPTCARAFRGGAVDFLEKPVDDEELLRRIHTAFAMDAVRRQHSPPAEVAARLGRLTTREREVMDQLVAGKSIKQIALLFNVTVQTVWRHRLSILEKLHVDNDVELVRAVLNAPVDFTPPADA